MQQKKHTPLASSRFGYFAVIHPLEGGGDFIARQESWKSHNAGAGIVKAPSAILAVACPAVTAPRPLTICTAQPEAFKLTTQCFSILDAQPSFKPLP